MQTREWRFPEAKEKLREHGPWQDEPDKRQWLDEATGLPCLIVRGPAGALCGYVGVPAGHPWFEKGYDDCKKHEVPEGQFDETSYIEVHGGLTYASHCAEKVEKPSDWRVCHIVESGEDDNVWWLGFDCAHAGDLTPYRRSWAHEDGDDIYRNIAYVTAECGRLAAQIKAAH